MAISCIVDMKDILLLVSTPTMYISLERDILVGDPEISAKYLIVKAVLARDSAIFVIFTNNPYWLLV